MVLPRWALDSLSVRVLALARDIVLCSWTRHFTLAVLSVQPGVQMNTGKFYTGSSPAME